MRLLLPTLSSCTFDVGGIPRCYLTPIRFCQAEFNLCTNLHTGIRQKPVRAIGTLHLQNPVGMCGYCRFEIIGKFGGSCRAS